MRRPLALFGLVFFAAMLLAVALPSLWLWLGAGFAALALAGVALARRQSAGWAGRPAVPAILLSLAAVLAALAVRGGYDLFYVNPLQRLAGGSYLATARVLEVQPGYGEALRATLQVTGLEAWDDANPDDAVERPAKGAASGEDWALLQTVNFRVRVDGLAQAAPGDLLRLPLQLDSFAQSRARTTGFAKGYRLGATLVGEVENLGISHTVLTRLRQLQYAASDNILQRLPLRLSGIAAAVSVGDRRYVPAEATEAYRAAGLSHLMVVSGLHLALLCGAIQALVGRLTRRRWVKSLVGIAFVLFFMSLAGLSPSILRSGFMWIIVYIGGLARRRADTYTSLAAAAILLLLQNPYAAADVGLQLSFAATLGVVLGGTAQRLLRQSLWHRWPVQQGQRAGFAKRAGIGFLCALVPSLCTTLATLPILVWAGMGVSLMTVPANLLVLPLVTPLVLAGLAMALPLGAPVLNAVGLAGSLVCGLLLRGLEIFTGWCRSLPGVYLQIGGFYALVCLLVVYALLFVAFRSRRRALFLSGAVGFLALALGLNALLSAGTVRVVAAGSGAQSSLVVIQGQSAAVVYRHRNSLAAIERVLRQNNVEECLLWADIRGTVESREYEAKFAPLQTVVAQTDLLTGGIYRPFADADVTITVARQAGGTAACADVAGYKVGLCAGAVDLDEYAPLDVLVAGSGQVRGEYGMILVGATLPEWANQRAEMLQNSGDAVFWLRPGKSVRISACLEFLEE